MGDALQDLGVLYDTHAPRIYRYLYHRLGDKNLAEDLTGEVFVRFLHARIEPGSPAAYLYRIAHNLVVDHLRRNSTTVPLEDDVPAQTGDPVQIAEMEMERSRLRRALARLTREQEQVIVLKFLEGLTNEEIAAVIGKPVGAVKSLQHRGLATLRDWLAESMRRDGRFKDAGRAD